MNKSNNNYFYNGYYIQSEKQNDYFIKWIQVRWRNKNIFVKIPNQDDILESYIMSG